MPALVALALAPSLRAQDPFEPNDTCADAAVVPLGTTTGLTLGPDDDFYLLAAPADAWIQISAVDGAGNDLDVELHDVGCAALLAASSAAPLRYADCGGAARDLVVRVPAGTAVGVVYELRVSAAPIADDSFEPNDSCPAGGPAVIGDYMLSGLVVTRCSEDFWAIGVQGNNYEVRIETLFDPARGDLQLELYDDACTLLASSINTAHGKALSFLNSTTAHQTIKVRVAVAPGGQLVDYALTACFGAPPYAPLIGYQGCIGVPNSTGAPAAICAWGSDFQVDNDVNLYIGDLPMGSFGYFLASQTYLVATTPGNSMGNLCLGTPGRYSFDVLNSNAGFVAYVPDLSMTPIAGGGFAPVQAGERWYWQYWYRDAFSGVATSNFSGALYIDFL